MDYDFFWQSSLVALRLWIDSYNTTIESKQSIENQRNENLAWNIGNYVLIAIHTALSNDVEFPKTPRDMTELSKTASAEKKKSDELAVQEAHANRLMLSIGSLCKGNNK